MLAVLGVTLSTLVFTAAPASAAVECSGTITYSRTHSSGLGELVIYYNSSNGGTNSACFYHRGAAYGVSARTHVQIVRCRETSGEGGTCTPNSSIDTDTGNFSYYAGPVGVTGTVNNCVNAHGYIEWGGFRYSLTSGRQGC